MSKEIKKQISSKTHHVLSLVHRAFMQPHKAGEDNPSRKQLWLDAWSEAKKLSLVELKELKDGIDTTCHTLHKLGQKVEELRTRKLQEVAQSHSLESANEWEEDEFLDSSANLPVFNPKNLKPSGKRWVMTKPSDKPKNTIETCQALWTVITNRAIYLLDKGKEVKPSLAHDLEIEKQRLAVLPYLLDDKIISDPLTGKPVMNLYMITADVKETLLWLLAHRAKSDQKFAKLFGKFLKKEIIAKEKVAEWAKKFTPQAQKILIEIAE